MILACLPPKCLVTAVFLAYLLATGLEVSLSANTKGLSACIEHFLETDARWAKSVVHIGNLCSCLPRTEPIKLLESWSRKRTASNYMFTWLLWHWAGVCLGETATLQDVQDELIMLGYHDESTNKHTFASLLSDFGSSIVHGMLWSQAQNSSLSSVWQVARRYCSLAKNFEHGCLDYKHGVGHAAFYLIFRRGSPYVQPMPYSYSFSTTKLSNVADQCRRKGRNSDAFSCLSGVYHSVMLYSADNMSGYCSRIDNCEEASICLYSYYAWTHYSSGRPLQLELTTNNFSPEKATWMSTSLRYCDMNMSRCTSNLCTNIVNKYAMRAASRLEFGYSVNGVPKLRLRNGVVMPMIAAGTAFATPAGKLRFSLVSKVIHAVNLSLAVGFRHLDLSNIYLGVERLRDTIARVPRRDLFLSYKVNVVDDPLRWQQCLFTNEGCYNAVVEASEEGAELLGVEYFDLLMLHHPPSLDSGGFLKQCERARYQWRAMQHLYRSGLTYSIGVSNFCFRLLQCTCRNSMLPHVVQAMHHVGMGLNPFNYVAWSHSQGIAYQAYSPLGASDGAMKYITSVTEGIAKRYGTSSAQIALRWVAQQGLPAVIASVSREHLVSDLGAYDLSFSLSPLDMRELSDAKLENSRPSFWASQSCKDSPASIT